MQQSAGFTGISNATCAAFTFAVAGQTFQTPATCQQGYAYYHGTIYSCGPASTGTHCKADGYEVSIDLATGGACSDTTGLNPGSWSSWSQVPATIVAAMRCRAPTVTRTFDWSAKVHSCTVVTPAVPDESTVMAGGAGESFVRVLGDPTGAAASGPWRPLISEHDQAQTGNVHDLPDILRSTCVAYGPLVGLDVHASVTVEEYSSVGVMSHSSTSDCAGRVLADGRFDVTVLHVAEHEGRPVARSTRIRQDGFALYSLMPPSEEGNVYTGGYARRSEVFALLCGAVIQLHAWVARPLELPRFVDSSFGSPTVLQDGTVMLDRFGKFAGVDAVSERYHLDASQPVRRPLSRSTFDAAGRVRTQTTWSDPLPVSEGVVRPRNVRHVEYSEGDPSGPHRVTRLSIRRAQAVAAGGGLPELTFDEDRVWNVWR